MPSFHVLLIVSQLLGLSVLVLVGYWTGCILGGFAWNDGSTKEFNLHPLLMTIGLVYLYGNGILLFRVFPNQKKTVVKVVHIVVQVLALVLACIALRVVFHFHKMNEYDDMYTMHSWVGLTAFILFSLQWLVGFVAFFFPKLSDKVRRELMPIHRYVGVATFATSIATCFVGIYEELDFSFPDYGKLPKGAYVGNFLGFSMLLFGLVVGYLVTNPSYKRPPPTEPIGENYTLK